MAAFPGWRGFSRRQRRVHRLCTFLVIVTILGLVSSLTEAITPAAIAAAPVDHHVDVRTLPLLPAGKPVDAASAPAKPAGDFTPLSKRGTDSRFQGGKSTLVAGSQAQYSEDYANPDGSHTLKLSNEPLNVQDSHGAWHPVDTAVAVDPASKRAHTGWHPLAPSFAATADDPALVSVAVGGDQAGLALRGATAAKAATRGPTVTYPDALAGTDLAYTTTPGSVKESLILKAAPAAGQWSFDLSTHGLTPVLAKNGGVELRNGAGHPELVIPAPEVWDSAGNNGQSAPAQTGGTYTITPAGSGRWTLTVSVDTAWLHDAKRVYPVTVDPTLTYTSGSLSWYKSDGASGTDTVVKVGNSQSGTGGADTYLRTVTPFPLSTLAGKNVVGSRVDVNWENSAAQSHTSYNVDMFHATASSYNGAPGAEYLAHGVIGDFGSLPGIPPTVSGTPDALTNFLRGVVSASNWGALFGFVGQETAGKYTYKRLTTSLLVDYGSAPTVPSINAPADNSVLTTTTPTLTVNPATDADGEAITYCFAIATGPDAASGVVAQSGCQTGTSWTVPAGVLQDGVAYTWKADSHSNLTTTTGAIGHVKIDKRIGDHGPAPTDTVGPVTVNLANGNANLSTSTLAYDTVGGSQALSFTYNSQAADEHGLTASYFNDPNDNGLIDDGLQPALVRTEPQVNVDFGNQSPYSPVLNPSWYIVRWDGFFQAPATGTYQFAGVHDDGLTVTLNGTQIYNYATPSDVNWSSGQATGSVALTAGQRVPIQVTLAQGIGAAHLQLFVRTTDGTTVPAQLAPAAWLYKSALPALPQGWTMSTDLDGTGQAYTRALVTAQNVVLTDSSGAQHTWTKAGTGTGFTPPAGEDGVLATDASGKITLTEGDMIYTFRADGSPDTATSAVDVKHPAALHYIYDDSTTPSRLKTITDPVSGRSMTLYYNRPGDTCYTGLTPPPGADANAPSQMLCRVAYWDGRQSVLWYTNTQLSRIEDPGSEVTDFGYDTTSGLLTKVREPIAADWVALDPTNRDNDNSRWVIGYTGTQAASVTAPAPTIGAARPAHSYRYDPANSQTFTDIAGISPAVGFSSKATYDTAFRQLTATDATGKVSSTTWNVNDLQLTSTDPAGRESTTVYDYAQRPTDSYGPAPTSCFTGQQPTTGCADTVTHTHTNYDENLQGLGAQWYANTALSGAPASLTTGTGNADGSINHPWHGAVPSPGIPATNFSLRAIGEIVFPASGNYTLKTLSDDGVRVWVDDLLVIDDWQVQGATWTSATVHSGAAGEAHRIRLEYFQGAGDSQLELDWVPPGGAQQVVPGVDLRPRYNLPTSTVDSEDSGVPDKVTATSYSPSGIDPAYGVESGTTQDPGGLNLTESTTYETPGTGYLRKTSKVKPTGAATTYAYYGDTETRANPCVTGSTAVNQGGMPKLITTPTPATGAARTDELVYDASGHVVAEATSGDWTCTTYDSRDRITQKVFPANATTGARTVTYNYAVGGDPLTTSVTDPAGTVTTQTDLLGRTISYTDATGLNTTTSYDQAGRVTQTTSVETLGSDPSKTATFTYDDAGRVLTETFDAVPQATITYDSAGELATATYGNGTSLAAIGKDQAGRITSLTWQDDASNQVVSQVARTRAGTIIGESLNGSNPNPAGNDYSYDAAGRLTEAYTGGGHHFTYDYTATASASCPTGKQANAGANTNLVTLTDATTGGTNTTNYCYDAADRLMATLGTNATSGLTYDTHGNTTAYTTAGITTHLAYDGADRNIQLSTTGAPTNATIAYTRDATDRIIRRDATAGDPVTSVLYGYTSGGDTPDVTCDTNHHILTWTLTLPGGVVETLHNSADPDTWDAPSVRGDLVWTTDNGATQVGDLHQYDPFGNPLDATTGNTNNQAVPDNSPGQLDYGWLGQHQRPYEHAQALSIVEMGARAYSPLLGRFLQVDPVDGGSANDYDYVNGDPINNVDLDGRCPWYVSWACSAGRAIAGAGRATGRFFANNWRTIAGVGVAILGGVAASVCGATIVCGVAVGVLGGIAAYSVGTAHPTWGGAARSGIAGAVTGGFGKLWGRAARVAEQVGRGWSRLGRMQQFRHTARKLWPVAKRGARLAPRRFMKRLRGVR
ncbi:MAG TPA: PA14 domain-containing protein [Amycolatopsis sp.]|nr:PA14 domain-containing protein [Amycolatopsis sp.]